MTRAVIFDLDGTLIDTLTSTYKFFKKLCKLRKKAFKMNGNEINSVEDFRRNWRLSVGENFQAIGYAWPKNKEQINKMFLEHRIENPPEITPGMYELLARLYCSGIKLGIVTASPEILTTHALRHNNIPIEAFDAIVTEDGTFQPKPSSDYLFYCMDIMEVKPENTIYVGDTVADVYMAGAATATSIAMRWKHSFSTARQLLEADPDHSAIDARDLERTILHLLTPGSIKNT